MPHATVDSLVEALRGRPILSPQQFDELIRRHAPAHSDNMELARTLIRLGWLTVYQAKKLLSGNANELVIGQYVIVDKLGEGGMGKVYKATQLSLNRVVALKIVRSVLLRSEIALKRFHREARAAARLRHVNIVHVFDCDHVGDRHFLCMEYIDGVDLSKLVKSRGALPIPTACSYVRQAALGLQHAHERGMVHRDIKPGNLLVAADGTGQYSTANVVKILDMGLARSPVGASTGAGNSTELTQTGMVIGTPDYMSPEQAKNSSSVDHRSDLYSLGCTFYYLLTAEIPFPNGTPVEKLLQHQMDASRPVRQLRPDVPPEIANIVQCLLAKRPEDRFQSAAALAKALARWAAGSAPAAILAPPPPAEAVDPLSGILESSHPFDFGDGSDPAIPEAAAATETTPAPAGRHPGGRSVWRHVLVMAGVFAVFLCVGALAARTILGGRKKTDPPPPPPVHADQPKAEPARPAPKHRPNPPPAKEMETAEKFLPDDASVAVLLDLKQWQADPGAHAPILGPVGDRLAGFRDATGVDLLTAAERVVVAVAADEETVVIVQGRELVTPRLTDGVKELPGVHIGPAWDGGPELVTFAADWPRRPVYAAAAETSVIISPHRRRVIEALEKRDGGKRTRLADPTVARALDHAHDQSFAAFVAVGLNRDWAKLVGAASKLNFAAAGVVFDDQGMTFHTLAEETEPGRAIELQRAFGRVLAEKAKLTSPPDPRLDRLAGLVRDAEPTRLPPPRLRLAHTQRLVAARDLADWLAPFFAKGDG